MVWVLLGAALAAFVAFDIYLYAKRRQRIRSDKARRLRVLARDYAWNRVMRRPLHGLLTDQRNTGADAS